MREYPVLSLTEVFRLLSHHQLLWDELTAAGELGKAVKRAEVVVDELLFRDELIHIDQPLTISVDLGADEGNAFLHLVKHLEDLCAICLGVHQGTHVLDVCLQVYFLQEELVLRPSCLLLFSFQLRAHLVQLDL